MPPPRTSPYNFPDTDETEIARRLRRNARPGQTPALRSWITNPGRRPQGTGMTSPRGQSETAQALQLDKNTKQGRVFAKMADHFSGRSMEPRNYVPVGGEPPKQIKTVADFKRLGRAAMINAGITDPAEQERMDSWIESLIPQFGEPEVQAEQKRTREQADAIAQAEFVQQRNLKAGIRGSVGYNAQGQPIFLSEAEIARLNQTPEQLEAAEFLKKQKTLRMQAELQQEFDKKQEGRKETVQTEQQKADQARLDALQPGTFVVLSNGSVVSARPDKKTGNPILDAMPEIERRTVLALALQSLDTDPTKTLEAESARNTLAKIVGFDDPARVFTGKPAGAPTGAEGLQQGTPAAQNLTVEQVQERRQNIMADTRLNDAQRQYALRLLDTRAATSGDTAGEPNLRDVLIQQHAREVGAAEPAPAAGVKEATVYDANGNPVKARERNGVFFTQDEDGKWKPRSPGFLLKLFKQYGDMTEFQIDFAKNLASDVVSPVRAGIDLQLRAIDRVARTFRSLTSE